MTNDKTKPFSNDTFKPRLFEAASSRSVAATAATDLVFLFATVLYGRILKKGHSESIA